MINVETKLTNGLPLTAAVQEYYGETLQTSADLKTSACCTIESIPSHIKDILKDVHTEVLEKFYGCGSPIPQMLHGQKVLDLGSGSGRDCYVMSKLVGETGSVTGVDMTDQQLEVARKHLDYHRSKFAFKTSNVRFLKGNIEDLKSLDIGDNSMDLVTSNCVVNLAPDKQKVFAEIFRVLKPGGEFYFSDVFASRRVPENLQKDPVFVGECLGGALYTEDFRRMLADLGCKDFRVIAKSAVDLRSDDMKKQAGEIKFFSLTIRAFKIDLEDRCEDFGQVARYKGGDANSPLAFRLDDHHLFELGKYVPVCGNTAKMLSQSRFAPCFEVLGDTSRHLGLFDCAPVVASGLEPVSAPGACC